MAGIAAGPIFRGVDRHGRILPGRLTDRSVALIATLHRLRVTITYPALWEREAVVVRAIDAGEATPAAIAACRLPLTGEMIDFDVREIDATDFPA